MREEDILDELQNLNKELNSFPENAHWFCPKRNDDDLADYGNLDEDEDDITPEIKAQLIEAVQQRHKVAYKYSLVFGLPLEESGGLLDSYASKLNRLLSACDKCVHNWHLGRKAYLKELSERFDEEVVQELAQRLNTIDFQRIDQGLAAGREALEIVEPLQRTQAFLAQENTAALLALYEALCSVDYHKSDDRLAPHFDYVFEQLQNRKVLRMKDVLPAMARFLFSRNSVRSKFAIWSWQKMSSMITPEIFEWVIHDVLSEVIALMVQVSSPPEMVDVEIFWRGVLLIIEKMDSNIITHCLRGMEIQPDIYRLAIETLPSGSSAIVEAVIKTLEKLLAQSPKDFWLAMSEMGIISPSSFAEQIFQSPGYNSLLTRNGSFTDFVMEPATSWIPFYLNSLQSIQQHDACRFLLKFLLEHFQDEKKGLSEVSRFGCVRAGIDALHSTLLTFTSATYQINPSTSLIVIGDIMGLVNSYNGTITGCADLDKGDLAVAELKRLGMLVIKDALTLDCKAISAEFYALSNDTKAVVIHRGSRDHTQSIWQAVLDIFRPGNIELAQSILPAVLTLTGLDELRPKDKKNLDDMSKDHIKFNKDFHELLDNIAKVFERLSDFSSASLTELIVDSKTARALFAALISSDQGIYEATIEVIKAMTGEEGKQDAMQKLLEDSLCLVLNALSNATVAVGKAQTFGAVPHLIKTSMEVLKALCGNSGVLRTRPKLSTEESQAVLLWWRIQWKALDGVFSATEGWAPTIVKPMAYMQDFCRDAMEYAEALFNEHTIFASVLQDYFRPDSSRDLDDDSTRKIALNRVLQVICNNIDGLVRMVRLRDSYLLSVITSLLVKLLRCLGEYQLEIEDTLATWIKDACKLDTGTKQSFLPVRTNLTSQQKAELQRALDENQGIELVEVKSRNIAPKKQSSIDGWSKLADGKRYEPSFLSKLDSLTPTLDKHRATLEKIAAQKNARQDSFVANRRKEAEERKRRDREAIAKANALRAPASVRGEGSGLKDIGGVVGKDHAPIRSEIMVTSSDEESDDGDLDETDSLVKTLGLSAKEAKAREERRKLAVLPMPKGPIKKTKIQRSAKDLRARVEPNMDRLYLEILNWDIFHPGDAPPSASIYRQIDNKYLDLGLYKSTFEPLLISEVWRSLVTAKDENNYKPMEIKVLNRLSVDKFMEISTTMPFSMQRDLRMVERDIVLLSKSKDPLSNPQEPHCLARVDRTNRKKDLMEVTYRVSRDLKPIVLQCLIPNSQIHAVKITDMTTTQREYAALSSLEYYDLCVEVLEAKPSPLHYYSAEKISLISNKYNLNRGQSQAILSASDNDGFTLIQGPPGSGKTKTICAMVGALLTPALQQQQVEQVKTRPSNMNGPAGPPPPKKKLLICAPSNAAVDELVVRLMEGIQPLNGSRQKIKVIRIGRSEAINQAVKDVTLDELVKQRMEGSEGERGKIQSERTRLHDEAGKIKERLNLLRPLMDEALSKGDKSGELALRREFDQLKRSQAQIGTKIDEDKEKGNTGGRQQEIARRQHMQDIIDQSHVLCATLSGSGHDMFRNVNVEFETVIIDEAAQCIELSALIPLKYGCSKCILVGDPEQLPPTVLSRSAQSYGYEQSLFVRMQKNHPKDVHLLDTQYRMHPEISMFPSQQFYHGRLIDGVGMAKLRDQPWHASSILGPYRFFDVEGIQTKEARGHSFINIPELNTALKLYERLKADYGKSYDFNGKIGIIATYKAQLKELERRFCEKFGDEVYKEIEFNTTDAFQGREREIIIFSCVRATQTGGIGFLKDIRRMNVGLTRAKSSLWVLGDSRSLQQGEFWHKLIEDAKARNRYTGGDVIRLLNRPTSNDRQVIREQQFVQASLPHESIIPSRPASIDDKMSTSMAKSGSDMLMADAHASRKVSVKTNSIALNTKRPDPFGFKQGPLRKPSDSSRESSVDVNVHGKRPRDLEVKEESTNPAKKAQPKQTSALDTALRAQEAEQAAKQQQNPLLAKPARPPGIMPPRRKAPADPFIQRRKR